ncbi:MAG: hypothetical protein ABGY09_00135 [Euryarchaeota archaeon]
MSTEVRPPLLVRSLTVVALAVIMLAKGHLHAWTAATAEGAPGAVRVMSVKRLPAVTERDLEPGPRPVFAWYRDPTIYTTVRLQGGYEVVPVPHTLLRYRVVVRGSRVDVYLGPISAPFTIVCRGTPRVSVSYSEVRVSGPCSIVFLRSRTWSGSSYPIPVTIVRGKMIRGYQGKARSVAILSLSRVPVVTSVLLFLGATAPLEIVSVKAESEHLEVDGAQGVIRSRGTVSIRWAPVVVPNLTYQDLAWRCASWPYRL